MDHIKNPLQEYRGEIDRIDRELTSLFCQRMNVAEKIAVYKAANNLPVFDRKRENELLEKVGNIAGEANAQDAQQLYRTILSLSKSRQEEILSSSGEYK